MVNSTLTGRFANTGSSALVEARGARRVQSYRLGFHPHDLLGCGYLLRSQELKSRSADCRRSFSIPKGTHEKFNVAVRRVGLRLCFRLYQAAMVMRVSGTENSTKNALNRISKFVISPPPSPDLSQLSVPQRSSCLLRLVWSTLRCDG